ncbi:Scaffold-type E3 ligase [Saxophila tyrrhenica]|uniref:Defective in cullin neddylation protein n=1 Tax=Saxophila tyrrhenica TaxID=1690608 RepID=A0AAV9P5I5_9PEZI|nr:Scaffold-type E3 ligase [Saxophila tyrrhenica]
MADTTSAPPQPPVPQAPKHMSEVTGPTISRFRLLYLIVNDMIDWHMSLNPVAPWHRIRLFEEGKYWSLQPQHGKFIWISRGWCKELVEPHIARDQGEKVEAPSPYQRPKPKVLPSQKSDPIYYDPTYEHPNDRPAVPGPIISRAQLIGLLQEKDILCETTSDRKSANHRLLLQDESTVVYIPRYLCEELWEPYQVLRQRYEKDTQEDYRANAPFRPSSQFLGGREYRGVPGLSDRPRRRIASLSEALEEDKPEDSDPKYFQNPSNNASNPIRTGMSKVFDKYRDNPSEEPDEINVEGVSKMLGEMGIGLEDIGSLVFSELVSSPSLGRVTRDGFLDGAVDVNADSLKKLSNIVNQRRSQLSKDRALFKNVYNHTFTIALQGNQKALPSEMALEFWKLLFSKDGLEWRTANANWLEMWQEFQEEKWKKAVNKDLWRQTLTFAEETMKDETLGFWSEESSWPSVIDDFVAWVKAEKGVGGDAMEVE